MGTKLFIGSVILFFYGGAFVMAQYAAEDWADRNLWMKVDKLLELAGIEVGDKVTDIGCHEGYLSFHLAAKVGKSGKVYSVDVQERRLETLRNHLKDRNVTNVSVILGDYDNPKLFENSLDAAIIMDTYHEMKEHEKILFHVKNALKPNGRILILEKLKEDKRGKNRDEQTRAHTLSPKYVKRELKSAGFSIVQEITDFGYWKNEADKTMWILVGVPNK